jgi:hypothetical protein
MGISGRKKARFPDLGNELFVLFLRARGCVRVQYNVFKVISLSLSLSLRNNYYMPNVHS